MRRSVLVTLVLLLAASCAGEAQPRTAAGALRLRRGDTAGAVHELRAAVALDPGYATAWLQLGQALFEAQRYDEAERSFRTALERDGNLRPARRALAQVAVRRGRPGEAERLLRALVATNHRDLDARLALAALLLARDDAAAAETLYRGATTHDHPAVRYGLGRALFMRGSWTEATAQFQALHTAAPHLPYSAYGRALVAARTGRTADACRALGEALARGLGDRRAVERDRELAPLRSAPCFTALVARRAEPRR